MTDPKEITKNLENLLQKIIDDPQNFEHHIESVNSYLQGLNDLSTNPIDKGTIPLFQFCFILLRMIFSITTQQKEKNASFDSNINNLLARVGRLEKEIESFKKGV